MVKEYLTLSSPLQFLSLCSELTLFVNVLALKGSLALQIMDVTMFGALQSPSVIRPEIYTLDFFLVSMNVSGVANPTDL